MKLKVLIVYDVHVDTPKGRLGWAFYNRAKALQKYAPDEFDVEIMPVKDFNDQSPIGFHLVFNLEYAADLRPQVKRAGYGIVYVVSYNADARRRQDWWGRISLQADWVICNNKEVFEFHHRQPNTCCISNGVDADIFKSRVPIEEREHVVFWTGSSNPKKGKGCELIEEARTELEWRGFTLDARKVDAIDGTILSPTEMATQYDRCSYVVCMSASEGTPNTSSEGAIMGCVPVSTRVGNIQEFGEDQVNCVLIDRTVEGLVQGLEIARHRRSELSAAAAATMRHWSYGPPGNRAAYYFGLFRNLINRNSITPFSYDETEPGVCA